MKKVLAVLLAVVLCFSVGVSAFAANLIEEPTATSGKVYLSVQSQYIDAGGDYTLPVSIISDYTDNDVGADAALALSVIFGITSTNPSMAGKVEFTGFQYADDIKNREGFLVGDDFTADVPVISCIIPGTDLLRTDRTEIGYISIHVDESIEFTADKETGEEDSLQVYAMGYTWGTGTNAYYDTEYCMEGKFAPAIDQIFGACAFAVIDTDGYVNMIEDGVDFITYAADCYQTPPVIPWTERIVNLLKLWGYQIVTGLTSLLQVAQSFLKPAA